jgi:hypothetical protein
MRAVMAEFGVDGPLGGSTVVRAEMTVVRAEMPCGS